MQDNLSYLILVLDEKNKNYSLLFQHTNIYAVISAYKFLIRRFPKGYIKVCREYQIYKGGVSC